MFNFLKDKKKDNTVRETELLAENVYLKSELERALEKVRALQKIQKKEIIDININDPAPVDSEKRKIYVSKIAGLHKEILEPKLKQMISRCYTILSESNNERDFDQSIKGAIYSFWELLRWGESMINEQIANQISQDKDLTDK